MALRDRPIYPHLDYRGGRVEALLSFAALSFERPQWSFPALTDDKEARFEAEHLQHPLMPPVKCVPNDVALGGELRLIIVSGSNMSGKSTFLRAIGLNCVLAWAGAPVAATQLRSSALQPAASIRVTDSLRTVARAFTPKFENPPDSGSGQCGDSGAVFARRATEQDKLSR